VRRMASGPQAVLKLDSRLGVLEAAHIDVRLKELESAVKGQFAADSRSDRESSEITTAEPLRLPSIKHKPESSDDPVTRWPEGSPTNRNSNGMDQTSFSQSLARLEARIDARVADRVDIHSATPRTPAPVSSPGAPEPQEQTAAVFKAMAVPKEGGGGPASAETRTDNQGSSSEVKARLEGLVSQVRQLLSSTHTNSDEDQTKSSVQANRMCGGPEQLELTLGNSVQTTAAFSTGSYCVPAGAPPRQEVFATDLATLAGGRTMPTAGQLTQGPPSRQEPAAIDPAALAGGRPIPTGGQLTQGFLTSVTIYPPRRCSSPARPASPIRGHSRGPATHGSSQRPSVSPAPGFRTVSPGPSMHGMPQGPARSHSPTRVPVNSVPTLPGQHGQPVPGNGAFMMPTAAPHVVPGAWPS